MENTEVAKQLNGELDPKVQSTTEKKPEGIKKELTEPKEVAATATPDAGTGTVDETSSSADADSTNKKRK